PSVCSTDPSYESRSSGDVVDKLLDGVADPDAQICDMGLWDPPETVNSDTESVDREAHYVFNPTPPGSMPDYHEVDTLSLRSWHSAPSSNDENPPEPVRQPTKKKVKKGTRDSATTQNMSVIRKLADAITEEGGLASAKLVWLDFESAYTAGTYLSVPLEVGALKSTLFANDVLSEEELALADELFDLEQIEPRDELTAKRILLLRDMLKETPQVPDTWYHRLLHPGIVPSKF
ncbi:TbRIF4-like protein, partial [Diplonema papillatum]